MLYLFTIAVANSDLKYSFYRPFEFCCNHKGDFEGDIYVKPITVVTIIHDFEKLLIYSQF